MTTVTKNITQVVNGKKNIISLVSLYQENEHLRNKLLCRTRTKITPISFGRSHVKFSGKKIVIDKIPHREELKNYCLVLKEDFSSQKYGPAVQEFCRDMLGATTIPVSEGTGDFEIRTSTTTKVVEVKCSFSDKINFRQIRIDRNIDLYLLIHVSLLVDYVFFGFVPAQVIKQLSSASCHGLRSRTRRSKDREESLTGLSINEDGMLSEEMAILEEYNYYGAGKHLVKAR